MKKLIFLLVSALLFVGLLTGCNGVTTPGGDYVWNEPNGHFKVTIPEGYSYSIEIPNSINNPKVDAYMFTKDETEEALVLWWEDKTVHNIDTLSERVQYNINFYINQFGASQPLSDPVSYKDGMYWIQKSDQLSINILFFLRQDPDGNFVGYEYRRPVSMGDIDNVNEMLKYLTSFKF